MTGCLPAVSFERERQAYRGGALRVAGLDEAGRGPLAGPVVAAAVILDPDRLPIGVADSKELAAPRRELLFQALVAGARVGVGIAPAAEIDRVNIRQATLAAMARALSALRVDPCVAMVDGCDRPQLPCPVEMVVDGDASVLSIAAASIVAKVVRDRLMIRLCRRYPGYGFAEHKGYATAAHRAALLRLGPCLEHRRSFAPVRELAGFLQT